MPGPAPGVLVGSRPRRISAPNRGATVAQGGQSLGKAAGQVHRELRRERWPCGMRDAGPLAAGLRPAPSRRPPHVRKGSGICRDRFMSLNEQS